MRVLTFDVRPVTPEDGVERTPDMDTLLRAADLVSVHVDLNATTERLFDRRRFAAMRLGAIFVNTSRGAVVDETALLEALATGRLSGAALDVLSGEPTVDAQHPLVRYATAHDRLLITPHIGGATVESMARCEEHLAGVVRSALRRGARGATAAEGSPEPC